MKPEKKTVRLDNPDEVVAMLMGSAAAAGNLRIALLDADTETPAMRDVMVCMLASQASISAGLASLVAQGASRIVRPV